MLRRPAFALLIPLLALTPAACKTSAATQSERPAPPERVGTLDDFENAYNAYALIPQGAARRAEYRAVMLPFLYEYLDAAIEGKDPSEAMSALQYTVGLYAPAELRASGPQAGLARRADAVYGLVARRGDESSSLLCLAIAQHFGDAALKKEAERDWALIERWLVDNGPYSEDPLLREESLERTLEQVSALFPSPFVVDELESLYVSRYDVAKATGASRAVVSSMAMRRQQITGYLLLRLHLRADDLEAAVASLERVDVDVPVATLGEMTREAMQTRRSATPLLTLADQFAPEPGADPSDPYVTQGWGIVDNLSRRAVRTHPEDAYAHLMRARALSNAGLREAAVSHLRWSIERKEDVFDAWQALAQLQQDVLADQADRDPQRALSMLGDVETMHARAAELWRDRPVEPGLPEAFYTVAEGLYQSGDVAQSAKLLERSLAIEPAPPSIDLLGTIALKRNELAAARSHYQDLEDLPFSDELSQLQWEARARAQLGEIELRDGNAAAASKHLRVALRHNNDLLARTAASPRARAERYIERGKLLFTLGDMRAAMTDFRKAADLDPGGIKVYADPLRVMVAHGYFDEAEETFRRAMSQANLSGNLKLYFSLWVHELALRQGHAAPIEAAEFLDDYRGTTWGRALSQHARGSLDFDGLLEAATSRGERAEAYFYEGLQRWRTGNDQGGADMMNKVVGTQMMGFFEFDMAQSYLRWGGPPATARLPLPARISRE
ncbi:MAG: tetratricopeptide repeat protein [Nannocystaceae bacterium]|nr:hypothetical protein [bacterium]